MTRKYSNGHNVESQPRGVPMPPACNTGASAACGSDWLGFTILAPLATGLDASQLLEELCLCHVIPCPEDRGFGFLGYEHSVQLCEGGLLAWGGQGGTAHVELSASALGYLRVQGLDMHGWYRFLVDHEFIRFTRLDLAFDDFKGLITYEKVAQAYRQGDIVRDSKAFDFQGDKPFGGESFTFYFGSRESMTFTRVYNKTAERGLDPSVHWVRVEVMWKKERAHETMEAWARSGFSAGYAVGLLRGAIDFRVNDGTVTKARWELAEWWSDFVGSVEKIKVKVGAVGRTIEDVARWLHRSVAGSLAAFREVYGLAALITLVEHGEVNMSPKHRRLVLLAGV